MWGQGWGHKDRLLARAALEAVQGRRQPFRALLLLRVPRCAVIAVPGRESQCMIMAAENPFWHAGDCCEIWIFGVGFSAQLLGLITP